MFIKNTNGPKLSSLFTSDNIEIYSNKENLDILVLKLLENLALSYGIGNIKQIYKTLYKEIDSLLIPITLSDQVIVCHFRLSTIERLQIAFAFLNNGIEPNKNNSTGKTKILIVIVSPKKRPDLFLKVEKALKSLFNNKNNKESLLKFTNSEGIWNFIDQTNECMPDNIYAGDIMTDVNETLYENNTLKDAIDLFVKSNLLNIPVIDSEKELIGEVNANELMKICLPRHILWMDDIGPIINFEPYYNMLQHEDNTWLAEIMTHEIAIVQIDDFAMKAAIAMTKKESNCAYVLDDKKLVGIITLEYFLNKVLR